PPGRQIHHRRLQPVARAEPLVLARQDPVIGGDLLARIVPVGQLLDESLAVCGDRDRILYARDRVAHADLDRSETRMWSDVPPDVRVVGDAPGALELADHLGVVGVVAETRRRSRARECSEDHLPARREPRGLAPPERRARRQSEEWRQLWQQAADDAD